MSINDDQIVEGVEFLTAHITAGDTFVSVGLQDTTIRVIDDGECVCVCVCTCAYVSVCVPVCRVCVRSLQML